MSEEKFDFDKEKLNLLDKINSNDRKVAFLFGSGISVSAKLPTMFGLTEKVEAMLKDDQLAKYKEIKSKLDDGEHLEHILNFLENISNLGKFDKFLGDSSKSEFSWAELNKEIRKCISKVISEDVELNGESYVQFAKWIKTRSKNTEVYTLNYDLVLESVFEKLGILYFDGFVGAVSPMFQPSAVDPVLHDVTKEIRPPSSWVRLWKMHGSINWLEESNGDQQIVRRVAGDVGDCLIYPSIAKYNESRRSPFLVLQDKLRRHLNSKNLTLVISGYGFGDEHINEILIDSMKRNKRLDVVVLSYEDIDSNKTLSNLVKDKTLNLSVFSPKSFSLRGEIKNWDKSDVENLGDSVHLFKLLYDSTSFESSDEEGASRE